MAFSNQSLFNATSGPLRLPLTVLETVLPGTSLLAGFLLGFGVDASLLISWIAVITAAWATMRFGLVAFIDSLLKAFTSCVVVEEYDPIYSHVLSWASAQKSLQNIRSLRTQTAGQYYDAFADGADEDDNHQLQLRETMSEDLIFNFNSWAARAPPQYRPHSSSGWFLHDYRLFRVSRTRDRVASEIGFVYEKERLDILVLWLSPKPIKKLIEEAREFVLARRTSTTTIKRPTPKSQRNSRHQAWTTMASRPSRSMATVVLDNYQKAHILKDFNEFLHPRTARWYSNRGIPYRRGYLFHGPPGTGKTSLSFALAGVFGLDIYSFALSEATLTEEDLVLLFNSLPKRCILLLEDVDTAGLGRAPSTKRESKHTSMNSSATTKDEQNKRGSLLHQDEEEEEIQSSATPTASTPSLPGAVAKEPTFKNTVTLSGLLNAIDGVASQEGRVLIMTTNHPERLDPALVRPGRVDLSIKFDLANRQQVKDLFMRMYCADTLEMTRQPTKISHILPNKVVPGDEDGQASSIGTDGGKEHRVHYDKESGSAPPLISQLAEEFANALPDRTFSPAEIQGFLLVRKGDPSQALSDVTAWRHDQLQKKLRQTTEGIDDCKVQPHGLKVNAESRPSASAWETNIGPGKVAESPAVAHVNGASPASGDASLRTLTRKADVTKLQESSELGNGTRTLPSATQVAKATTNASANDTSGLGTPPSTECRSDATTICETSRDLHAKIISNTGAHRLETHEPTSRPKHDLQDCPGSEVEAGEIDDEHTLNDGSTPGNDIDYDDQGINDGDDDDDDDDNYDYNNSDSRQITQAWFIPHGARGGSPRTVFGPSRRM
ncbi:hypothetical protein G647_03714 [Cladophialophora carrionii CBS 160.54]|uniref:AAA+ ATPase domain-containing protein n=1 Tax=Cladophialophora carrionii CBS 160.54 TaxID=1279043 RepID=V9DBX5_9EURO|nr:uncharacterized protein G647_03714 [Cladophialophora carrionii CBS 160.54]ETI24345.1 hypothetical protein G647_03714 [Cladophialophora carrionii CBS 160.54]